MVVVPSFSEGDQGDQQTIATIIFGGETPAAKNMRQRVDDERPVIDEHRADEEAPDQHLESGGTYPGNNELKGFSEC